MIKALPVSYFQNHDILFVANDLLGRPLMTRNSEGEESGGIIIETEAYMGPFDKASHAYNSLLTKRNEVMYGPGGFAYVYLCYGLHRMFNVVTNIKGIPHAILIRAIEPCLGLDLIQRRRKNKKNLGVGPGVVCEALGISLHDNACSLQGPRLWIGDSPKVEGVIQRGPRVGIDYAKEHALLPWRFCLKTQNPLPC